MIRIGLDVMGGDHAPQAPLDGIMMALKELGENFEIHLFGDKDVLNTAKSQFSAERIKCINTQSVIGMGDSPIKAIKSKPDSSIVVGLGYLKANAIDVFISAGNTGAVLVGAMYTVKAAEGIIRPAIASYIPNLKGNYSIMLDVGANPDVKPDVLYQFGVLGSLYAKHVLQIDKPKVGLINIGSEPEKGNLVAQAAHSIMKDSDRINFAGNIEGYDVFTGESDVLVCDGFVGNVLLKTAESLYKIFGKKLGDDPFIRKFDYQYYGATPILGINKPVLIGHGVSSPRAFVSMIKQAVDIVESGLV
ncbi:MAG: phosphate acyltransferase PlsX, partial [Bacteroidia bacterium]